MREAGRLEKDGDVVVGEVGGESHAPLPFEIVAAFKVEFYAGYFAKGSKVEFGPFGYDLAILAEVEFSLTGALAGFIPAVGDDFHPG